MINGTVHFEKVGASTAGNNKPLGDMGGYFGIPQAETALDRGLVEVNSALRKEGAELKRINATLKAQVAELETVLERVSYPITMYRANRP
jgi:hypothetical protein